MLRLAIVALTLVALSGPLAASEVALRSASTTVPLSESRQTALAERLESYFRACHRLDRVSPGSVLSQEVLRELWADQETIVHASLRIGHDSDAPTHPPDTALEVLFAFPEENDGLGPALARDPTGVVTQYIKCPGLEGLLLACQVHALVPGVERSSRCQEWGTLKADSAASLRRE